MWMKSIQEERRRIRAADCQNGSRILGYLFRLFQMMPRRNVNRQDEQDVPDVQYMLDVQDDA